MQLHPALKWKQNPLKFYTRMQEVLQSLGLALIKSYVLKFVINRKLNSLIVVL